MHTCHYAPEITANKVQSSGVTRRRGDDKSPSKPFFSTLNILSTKYTHYNFMKYTFLYYAEWYTILQFFIFFF